MLTRAIDRALDWAVLPGYTRLGYRARGLAGEPLPRLDGRSVLLTGASSGIGEAACAALAGSGAEVHMVARDRERGEAARARVAAAAGSEPPRLHLCDLSDLGSVRELATGLAETRLDVLVNNAGVLAPKRTRTAEGFELTFATNVLGPFALTALLLPALRAAGPGRVINVSSGGMYTRRLEPGDLQLDGEDFDGTRFYAHSKRAEVALTEEWARRVPADEVSFHSLHPGWVATPGVASSLPGFNRVMGPLLRSPGQGADTIVWLAGAPGVDEASGSFWHDRRARPVHRVPWTRESADDRARAFEECERLAGVDASASAEAA